MQTTTMRQTALTVPAAGVLLPGDLTVPEQARGLVVFAHGSGSSRHSPRNRHVAEDLNRRKLATFLFDLLTAEEEEVDIRTRHLRFDIPLLAERLRLVTEWLQGYQHTAQLPIGLFGASTGAAAALIAAVHAKGVKAVVSRGGRPDLAGAALPRVEPPVLLIVGGNDPLVIEMNRGALEQLGAHVKELRIVPGATHLFEEPGKLDEVARLAGDWFLKYLT
ncbi:MAG: alpha/beta hydrolase [Chitinivibrionales bacterium]|nr:alpha/beta hydrolase [Chitinivibrionales bacterium]